MTWHEMKWYKLTTIIWKIFTLYFYQNKTFFAKAALWNEYWSDGWWSADEIRSIQELNESLFEFIFSSLKFSGDLALLSSIFLVIIDDDDEEEDFGSIENGTSTHIGGEGDVYADQSEIATG